MSRSSKFVALMGGAKVGDPFADDTFWTTFFGACAGRLADQVTAPWRR
jgi:hypothetical protein